MKKQLSRAGGLIRVGLTLTLLCARSAPIAAAAQTNQPAPESLNVLAISVSPRLEPPPTLPDFIAAFDLALTAGARGDLATYKWSDLEPAPHTFSLEDLRNHLNYSAGTRGLTILLGLQVINTTAKETPSDLKGASFNSPEMKSRFRALIDALGPELNRSVTYLSIGNEVDIYLLDRPAEWAAYKDFCADAVAYIHTVAPKVKVGVTVTQGGAAGNFRAQTSALLDLSDVGLFTYYPESPGAVIEDFRQLVALAAGRPVVLQEVGHFSSGVLGSSEEKQAQFVSEVFAAWKLERNQIPFLNFFLLHDLTRSICDELAAYYGLPADVNFKEFLCSLGLRRADGTPKAAWRSFINEAARFNPPAVFPAAIGASGLPPAIALDSVTLRAAPFAVTSAHNLSTDGRIRLALFASGVLLLPGEEFSSVAVTAETRSRQIHQLPVEFVGGVPQLEWMAQIVVRIPDEVAGAGDVQLTVSVRGVPSGKTLVRID